MRSKTNGFDSYRKFYYRRLGRQTELTVRYRFGRRAVKGFLATKDNSALHHFQSFPTLFDIRKIPSSLPNGETSTFSGLRLLSSLSKPAALTAAGFTSSFHISLFVDPLVSQLLWNKLKCSSTCSAKMLVSVTEVSFSRFACFTSADWSLRCVILVFTKRLLWDVLAVKVPLKRNPAAINNT